MRVFFMHLPPSAESRNASGSRKCEGDMRRKMQIAVTRQRGLPGSEITLPRFGRDFCDGSGSRKFTFGVCFSPGTGGSSSSTAALWQWAWLCTLQQRSPECEGGVPPVT